MTARTFTDVSDLLPPEVHDGYAFAGGWFDLDRDGWLDLYVVHDFGRSFPNRLLWNREGELVLDDGDVVSESHSILDYLDSLVPAAERLFPVAEPTRHRALRVATLATGLCEQAVSVFYERRFHKVSAEALIGRRSMQMRGTAAALEADRAARPGAYWFGERIGHADIAVAAMARFTSEALPGLIPIADHPALADHCRRLEALPVFQAISQPFMPPA
mgnify:CR=1 FL=1